MAEFTIPLRRALRHVLIDESQPFSTAGKRPTVRESRIPDEIPAPAPPVAAPNEDALKRDHESFQRAVQAIASAAQTLADRRDEQLDQVQRLAVTLACDLASHLTHATIQADNFPVEEVVRSTVEELQASHAVDVRLNPDDVALLEKRLGPDTLRFTKKLDVRLVADPAIARGNCAAESGDAGAVSRWEEQLEKIRGRLQESLGHA
jgi:flagellar biosynthesis/type III secretory pathway protein FliH